MKLFTHNFLPSLPKLREETSSDGKRAYVIPDGKRYPSVTTVLSLHSKEGIDSWKKRVGPTEAFRQSTRGKNRGSRFHDITEQYLRNEPCGDTTFLDADIFQRAQPVLNRIDNIRLLETPLWSHFLRLAGRLDCFADFDNVPAIVDFKTAKKSRKKGFIEHYFMQATAYSLMVKERYHIKVEDIVILMAVDDEHPQVFKEKTYNWVEKLLHYRDLYEGTKSVV